MEILYFVLIGWAVNVITCVLIAVHEGRYLEIFELSLIPYLMAILAIGVCLYEIFCKLRL